MEADLAAFIQARRDAADTVGCDPVTGGRPSRERRTQNAQSAFDRAYATASGLPGASKPDRETSAKLNELDSLTHQVSVSARLEALKAMRKAG